MSVFAEYDYRMTRRVRYGEGAPVHARIAQVLAAGSTAYAATARDIDAYADDLHKIAVHADPERPTEPHWANSFLPGLDIATLYAMVAARKPAIYCEIGSGHSTRVAALAKRMHSPQTRIVSIDPSPRADVAGLCDDVVRAPLQDCDLSIFAQLRAGDFLFLDGSHQVLQNSDVSVFFLEVLPMLAPGVIVQIHDMCWPADYPSAWLGRMYSEQYMLGMLLIYAPKRVKLIAANGWISLQERQPSPADVIWSDPALIAAGIAPRGSSFWFMLQPAR